MKKIFPTLLILFGWFTNAVTAQNTMPIPPVLSGENITLTLQEGTTALLKLIRGRLVRLWCVNG